MITIAQERRIHMRARYKPWETIGGSNKKNYPGKRHQTVCVRSIIRKSRDLDALGVMKVGIVVTVRVSVSESECE